MLGARCLGEAALCRVCMSGCMACRARHTPWPTLDAEAVHVCRALPRSARPAMCRPKGFAACFHSEVQLHLHELVATFHLVRAPTGPARRGGQRRTRRAASQRQARQGRTRKGAGGGEGKGARAGARGSGSGQGATHCAGAARDEVAVDVGRKCSGSRSATVRTIRAHGVIALTHTTQPHNMPTPDRPGWLVPAGVQWPLI